MHIIYLLLGRVSNLPNKACGDPLLTGKLFRQTGILLDILCLINKVLAYSLHSLAEMPLLL